MKKNLWAVCYGIVLTAFTIYITLDTFILTETYRTGITEMNTAMFEEFSVSAVTQETTETMIAETEAAPTEIQRSGSVKSKHSHHNYASDTEVPENSVQTEETQEFSENQKNAADSYSDENISITLTEYYENNTRIYVADVWLTSAEFLKTAFAEDTYGKNITDKTSAIAAAHQAILAINGDYYGAQEKGVVIRNGIVYRDSNSTNDMLCIYADGTMKVISPEETTAQELVSQGVWQAFSFGPGLIENGNITVTQGEEVGKAMASNPRTAIGIIDQNHYLFVVSDGRTDESEGLSLYELAEFMQKLNVVTAYNLDGGGSSTMYFNGQVINNPTTNGNIKERKVSDIVYIG